MEFIPVPNVAEVEIRFLRYDQICENTLSFKKGSAIDLPALQFIAEHVSLWWFTYLRGYQSGSLVLTEVFAKDLTYEDGLGYACTTHAGQSGSSTVGVDMPANVTWAISFRTGYTGRSYRGRNYVLGLRSTWLTLNNVSAAYREAMLAAYRRLLPGGGSDPTPWWWVVVSRRHNKAWREEGVATAVSSVTSTNDHLDSQRRRLTGRGY